MSITIDYAPPGKRLRQQASRDDLVKLGFMAVIGLYLIVALGAPLFVMLSKSMSTYRFDLSAFEFQVSDETGKNWATAVTADALNRELGVVAEKDLVTNSDGRLAATKFFPQFNFRSPVHYRIRGTTDGTAFLAGSTLEKGTQWREYDSATFRRVVLRPASTIGVENFKTYFSTPALARSIYNSVLMASISTVVTVSIAFALAYALTRSCMPLKGLFRGILTIPILVPSLLPGIALVYLFGNQGVFKDWLLGYSIYGPIGIVIGSVFFTLPHAFLIILTALSVADARHYEAAASLRAGKWRTFTTVTVPGARYGLVSAAFVVFTLVITDFGLPKVIGGQYGMLAVDIYKQVIGQQNFEMGAVVSVILLVPAVLAFAVDRRMQKRQVALLSARAVPYAPKRNVRMDGFCFAFSCLVSLFILGMIAMCQIAALVKFWPYDLTLTTKNFAFDLMDGGGWAAYANSIKLALLTAFFGSVIVFAGAYMVEKADGFRFGRGVFHFLAMMPMAVPGMVLGLAYIFFFNNPANPLNSIYGTMTILVVCTVTHFYTVAHLTALTALKQMDPEFESVGASLKQPFHRLFFRVTLPVCLPAILNIGIYLFVNAMTTVSAVVFLYSTDTKLASVAVLNMDDAGDIAPAAAMGMMIFYTNVVAKLIHAGVTRGLLARTQAWR
ncbi:MULTISPECIES: putative 2-aminoethylphosphonate ABC transporter permease subunit [unclassified Ensifer]|uniref:putative 2-aminoethylphosphonate ABC transporter permease subunit n=1 Tax=unclassified Ensifer TaxID=2633371 RepID=UPI00042ED404|nr:MULTISPECIES: putative 2-aminoethylphosphonate ABC transporter permease subunit [unclassified Ensifer]AHK46720.1 putative transmembrane component of ABC transporter [Ensifer adhaerens OV14]MBD9489347.1 putative 2-aminoethylphosphonate ABC transporter permease subunit [Ensifer sp. ENS11]MDP9629453.1 iron(III) transport system permease protein [Ensifer adhaerens]OMQ46333.1 iron ABC transporter permease [Ensifer sp. 1H6]